MCRKPLQHGFQPLGVGGFGGETLPALCNEQGEKAQQCPFYQQLVAGALGAVGILQLPQAGGGLQIAQIVRGQPHRQRQPTALQRQQIFFGAKILRAAQQLRLKDDIFVFHTLPLCLPQRVERARGKKEDIPPVSRVGHHAHLYQPHALLDKDKLHALVPVECYLLKIPRNGAGIQIERKPHCTVLFCLLQRSLILHRLTP